MAKIELAIEERKELTRRGTHSKRNSIQNKMNYFAIRGGSLKKIAKKMIPNVPISKKV